MMEIQWSMQIMVIKPGYTTEMSYILYSNYNKLNYIVLISPRSVSQGLSMVRNLADKRHDVFWYFQIKFN